jgi:hypothetical protein
VNPAPDSPSVPPSRRPAAQARTPPDTKWVLKANIHRGKGVSVLPQREAVRAALQRATPEEAGDLGTGYRHILVQSYLSPQVGPGGKGLGRRCGCSRSSRASRLDCWTASPQNPTHPLLQMEIGGRSSYLRVWLLVTSVTPLRAYLFKGGFVIFGKQRGGNGTSPGASGAAAVPAGRAGNGTAGSGDDLIVNLWLQDRSKSSIWSLARLEAHLDAHPEAVVPVPPLLAPGPAEEVEDAGGGGDGGAAAQPARARSGARRALLRAGGGGTAPNPRATAGSSGGGSGDAAGGGAGRRRTFADAWEDMRSAATLALAAGLPSMRAAAVNASVPPNGAFEYFGLDFVLDASLRPRLLEVNAVPSMARRRRSGCAGRKSSSNCDLRGGGGAAAAKSSGKSSSGSTSSSSGGGGLVDGFDEQKEAFIHDMLKILGLPIDAPPKRRPGAGKGRGSGGAGGTAAALQAAAEALGVSRWRSGSAGRNSSSRGTSGGGGGAAAAAAAKAKPAGSESRGGGGGSGGGARRLRLERRVVHRALLASVPKAIAELMCPSGRGGGGAAAAAASPAAGATDEFACFSCLRPSDLADLADAELELENVGRFEPAHDLVLAHALNGVASEAKPGGVSGGAAGAAGGEGGGSSGGKGGGGGSGKDGDSGKGGGGPGSAHRATVAAAHAHMRAAYLQDDTGVWQRLHRTWQALTSQRLPVRDLEVMEHFTTDAALPPAAPLPLGRRDYLMAAWLRAREEPAVRRACAGGGGGSGSAACVAAKLRRVVRHCYL